MSEVGEEEGGANRQGLIAMKAKNKACITASLILK